MKRLFAILLMCLPAQATEILYDTLDQPITGLVYTGPGQWIWQEFHSGSSDTLDNYFLNVSVPTSSSTGRMYLTFVAVPSQTPKITWQSEWRLDTIPHDQVTTIGISRFPEHIRLGIPMLPNTTYYFGMSGTVPVAWANTASGLSAKFVANYTVPEPSTWAMIIAGAGCLMARRFV